LRREWVLVLPRAAIKNVKSSQSMFR